MRSESSTSPTSLKRGLRISDLVQNDILSFDDVAADEAQSSANREFASNNWGVKQIVDRFCKRAFHELSSSPPKSRGPLAAETIFRTVKPSNISGQIPDRYKPDVVQFPKHPCHVIILSSDDHTGWVSSQNSDEYREKLQRVQEQISVAEESLNANNTTVILDISSSSPEPTTLQAGEHFLTSSMMNEHSTQTESDTLRPSQENSSEMGMLIKKSSITFSTPKPKRKKNKKQVKRQKQTSIISNVPERRKGRPPMKTPKLSEPRRKRQQCLPRSKNGCWTCRARRKKCDEHAPHCQACSKLGIKCAGYGEPRPLFMMDSDNCRAYKEDVSRQIKAFRRLNRKEGKDETATKTTMA